jgi:YbbR domain-containing protein
MSVLLRLWHVLSRNPLWKLTALLASTALWVAINGSEPNADRYVRLAVSPFGLPKRFVVANRITGTVDVQLRGPRSILRTIDEEAYRLPLDLRQARSGSITLKLSPDMLSFPRRVRAIRITPSRIDVRIERLVRKAVPIKPVLVPADRNGYTISGVVVTPPDVEVSGPAGRMERLQVVETEPISTLGASGPVEREAALTGAGEWLTFFPDAVRVSFVVREVEGRRTFTALPVTVRGATGTAHLEPAEIALTLRGPQSHLLDLQLSPGTAYVNATELPPGEHRLPVQIGPLESLVVDSVEPSQVKIVITPPDPSPARKGGSSP